MLSLKFNATSCFRAFHATCSSGGDVHFVFSSGAMRIALLAAALLAPAHAGAVEDLKKAAAASFAEEAKKEKAEEETAKEEAAANAF